MIVSVHLAKTAGTSFAATLEQHYGNGLRRDYGDLPMNSPVPIRNTAALQGCLQQANASFSDVSCIHGHFLPVKYLLLQDPSLRFITWMRHPVDRAISNYYFWRKNPATADQPLQRQMLEERWTLERFCLGEEFKDYYWQMLFAFPLDYFDFIGITEFYEEDLQYFANYYLQTSSSPLKVNVGDKEGVAYQLEPTLRARIEAFHSKDMALYRFALEKRQVRVALVS